MLAFKIFAAAATPKIKGFAKIAGLVTGFIVGFGAAAFSVLLAMILTSIYSFKISYFIISFVSSPEMATGLSFVVSVLTFATSMAGVIVAFEFIKDKLSP